jgi:hypothetical protein
MKRGRFCHCQFNGQMNRSYSISYLHPVGMASLHTLVLGICFSRQTLLELGFHVAGARVAVIPSEEVASSSDIYSKSVR